VLSFNPAKLTPQWDLPKITRELKEKFLIKGDER
jgi:hypothetical protein